MQHGTAGGRREKGLQPGAVAQDVRPELGIPGKGLFQFDAQFKAFAAWRAHRAHGKMAGWPRAL